jgi:transcriptional regulator with XRE-family HTH domain
MTNPQWDDKEYREAYMEASIEQAISWQVKINRQKRGLTKQQLADKAGVKVGVIERLEDPEINDHSIDLLVKVAKAFDCALSIKLLSYEQLAQESLDLSEETQYVLPFRTRTSPLTHSPEQTQ